MITGNLLQISGSEFRVKFHTLVIATGISIALSGPPSDAWCAAIQIEACKAKRKINWDVIQFTSSASFDFSMSSKFCPFPLELSFIQQRHYLGIPYQWTVPKRHVAYHWISHKNNVCSGDVLHPFNDPLVRPVSYTCIIIQYSSVYEFLRICTLHMHQFRAQPFIYAYTVFSYCYMYQVRAFWCTQSVDWTVWKAFTDKSSGEKLDMEWWLNSIVGVLGEWGTRWIYIHQVRSYQPALVAAERLLLIVHILYLWNSSQW